MSFAHELRERGFVQQYSTESLEEIVDSSKRSVYLGIDPTADAIHVGHLVPFMLLNHFLAHGHSVILLFGGGTALIGDPSGKDTERAFVEPDVVEKQAQKMADSIRALTVSGDIQFVNNHEWLSAFPLLTFLRDVGKHFTVNAMIKKDSVATRLASEQGISYTEFSYALLQSYDYYHLHKEYGCDLQIGASDQWGNISSGIDFIRRKTGGVVYGLTMPLLINPETGKKFGKTESGTVWLDPEKTSPYRFYQFWLNTPDSEVIRYLKLFTMYSLEEIADIESVWRKDPASRYAQKALASAVTTFVHGAETANTVAEVSAFLFGEGVLTELDASARAVLKEHVAGASVREGDRVVGTLIDTMLATSKREARTFIEDGAVSLNGEPVHDVGAVFSTDQFVDDIAILRRGKRQVAVITRTS